MWRLFNNVSRVNAIREDATLPYCGIALTPVSVSSAPVMIHFAPLGVPVQLLGHRKLLRVLRPVTNGSLGSTVISSGVSR
jgi:hypothetical protein